MPGKNKRVELANLRLQINYFTYFTRLHKDKDTHTKITGTPLNSSPVITGGPSDCITSIVVSRTFDKARISNCPPQTGFVSKSEQYVRNSSEIEFNSLG